MHQKQEVQRHEEPREPITPKSEEAASVSVDSLQSSIHTHEPPVNDSDNNNSQEHLHIYLDHLDNLDADDISDDDDSMIKVYHQTPKEEVKAPRQVDPDDLVARNRTPVSDSKAMGSLA